MPNKDLELRLTRLEHEVTLLREDVASSRALAALADRDVSEFRSELRAHRQSLQALRETQLEQGQQIVSLRTEMRQRFTGLDQRFDGIDQRFDGLDQRIDGIDQRFTGVDQRFDGLEHEMRAGFAMQATGMRQIVDLLTEIAGQDSGNN